MKDGKAAAHLPEIQRMQGSCALLGLKQCAHLLLIDPAQTPDLDAECLAALLEVELQLTLALEAGLIDA